MDQKPQNYWQPETDSPERTEVLPLSPRGSIAKSPESQDGTLDSNTQVPFASAQQSAAQQIEDSQTPSSAPTQNRQPIANRSDYAESQAYNEAASPQSNDSNALLAWRASEYIHHDKGFIWYLVLGLVTLATAALAFLLQQWLFSALIIVMGITITVFAHRPPHEVNYTLTPEGVEIEEKMFPYNQFRSFSVESEGAFYSLSLRPIKRFSMGVTIYFAESEGEQIVDILGARMPMEASKPDVVDQFMRWLRF